MDYFGGVVFEFTIKDAIANGNLCPYVYEPILVELDEDELSEYRAVVGELEDLRRRPDSKPEAFTNLLAKRSSVLNGASGKIERLTSQLSKRAPDRSLFYCSSRLQLGAVADVLRDAGFTPRPFTAEEGRRERVTLLQGFADGVVPALVAMNALDEGVDVPSTREAHILASSGNPRQFVQRRGRVLRTWPGKTHARVIDYVVVPEGSSEYERDLVEREMRRVLDFAETAMNADQARQAVFSILDRFQLIHIVGGS
jgi:superfamily II DNA or RNA helicase